MFLNRLSLLQKGLVMILIPLFFQVSFIWVLNGLVGQSMRDAAAATKRRELTEGIDRVFSLALLIGGHVMSYSTQKNDALLLTFEQDEAEVKTTIDKLNNLAGDDKKALAQIALVDSTIMEAIHILKTVKDEELAGVKKSFSFMNVMQQQMAIFAMTKRLQTLRVSINQPQILLEKKARALHQKDHKKIVACLAGGLVFNMLMSIIVALFFTRQITSRLAVVSENSVRLQSKQELLPSVGGEDEVGLLDKTFREMATALDEAARRQNEIINNSEDIVCSLTADGNISFISDASLRHWQRKPQEFIGRSIYDFVVDSDDDKLKEYFQKLLAGTHSDSRQVAVAMSTPSGQRVDASWSAHWSAGDGCFFCVVHDVTAEKERERLKERFINIIGHRLKTPLEKLDSGLHRLEEATADVVTPKGKSVLQNGIKSVGRIVQLVGELIELEQMSEGLLSIRLSPTPVSNMIKSAQASLQGMADFKQLKLVCSDSMAKVMVDERRLVQVMVNLLSNAVKYAPAGTTVTIEVVENEKTVTVGILDEGPGIPASEIGNLFARFKRLDREVDRQTTGTGLGLAICRTIVELHGGQIGAENRPEGGSRFFFTVPRSWAS